MRRSRRTFEPQFTGSVMAVQAAILLMPGEAHAYVDPGTGSMLLQLLGAGAAAALFYLRGLRNYLSGLLRLRKTETTDSDRGGDREPR